LKDNITTNLAISNYCSSVKTEISRHSNNDEKDTVLWSRQLDHRRHQQQGTVTIHTSHTATYIYYMTL